MPDAFGNITLEDMLRQGIMQGYNGSYMTSGMASPYPTSGGPRVEDLLSEALAAQTSSPMRTTHVVGADEATKQKGKMNPFGSQGGMGGPGGANTATSKKKESVPEATSGAAERAKVAQEAEAPDTKVQSSSGYDAPFAPLTSGGSSTAQQEKELQSILRKSRLGAALSRRDPNTATMPALAEWQALQSLRDAAAVQQTMGTFKGADLSNLNKQYEMYQALIATGQPGAVAQGIKGIDSVNDMRRQMQRISLAGQWRKDFVDETAKNNMIIYKNPNTEQALNAYMRNEAIRTVLATDPYTQQLRTGRPTEAGMLPEETAMGQQVIQQQPGLPANVIPKAAPAGTQPSGGAARPADLPSTWQEAKKKMVAAGKSRSEIERALRYWYKDYPGAK